MITQELIEEIRALPLEIIARSGDIVLTEDQKKSISSAYYEVTGKRVKKCSCKHRYADALIELSIMLNLKKTIIMKNYELISGRLIEVDGNPYSNANLTDEVAKKWCDLHPELVDVYFQRLPSEKDEKEIVVKPTKKK